MENTPKLQITIDNKQDIELFEFTAAMAGINSQYHRFLTQNKKQKTKQDCKLYVNRVSDGSIIIDLCEKAPEIMPIVVPFIMEYSFFLVQTLEYLSGKVQTLPSYRFAKEDFLNIKKILEPVANIVGNTINIKALNFEHQTIIINNNYSSVEANAIQNRCDKEIKRLERSGESLIKENVSLNLYQARDSVLSSSSKGNLGIVEQISDKPQVLSFANDRLRYDITKAETNPFNFIFNVDVEIKLREGSLFLEDGKDIKEYEILKLHGPIQKKDLFSSSDD